LIHIALHCITLHCITLHFQTTALLGVHTLGKATIENSGYNGSWIEGQEHRMDTKFYRASLSLTADWFQKVCTKLVFFELCNYTVLFPFSMSIFFFKSEKYKNEFL
jgi:hypothetical protein